jgi:GNAT superfamily N-acetyltransferase
MKPVAEVCPKILKRDIVNFIHVRKALPGDDLAVAELLTKTFISTYEKKLPTVATSDSRRLELQNVALRRRNGHVAVAELGFRIIGTFALIHPDAEESESWLPAGATLRCVAIDPDFHGLDLSLLLLKEAERVAKFWHSECICLHVQAEADRVASLYERNGYRRDPRGDKESHGNKICGYVKFLENSQRHVS